MCEAVTQYFFPMRNEIKDYVWGSRTAFSELFGIENPNKQPQAELWMGAHPDGCSTINVNGEDILLSKFIENQDNVLSMNSRKGKGQKLSYLFKVLAAKKALSIQVHPNKKQAKKGFNDEERTGVERTASNRNYKDPNHKPELIYALTTFKAMNGFRTYHEIETLLKKMALKSIESIVKEFLCSQNKSQGLRTLFTSILSMDEAIKVTAINELLQKANSDSDDPVFALILQLSIQYPNDVGLFCPIILNVIDLKPGEAMFLNAGTPHAYIQGTGLEVMASSDNVLRSGLTAKHMDMDELIKCTKFHPKPKGTLHTKPIHSKMGSLYPVPVKDFRFSVISNPMQLDMEVSSAEILMAIDGNITLSHESGEKLTIKIGESVFIPAYSKNYKISSLGQVARVF